MEYNCNHCIHSIRLCNICDSVYCTQCNKEWKGGSKLQCSYYPPVYSYPYITYDSTTTAPTTINEAVDLGMLSGCSHN